MGPPGVTAIAGVPSTTGSADDTNGLQATFNLPTGLATDSKALYVADNRNCTIRRVDLATYAVTTIAGIAGSCNRRDGAYGTSELFYPLSLATDGQKLYITDSNETSIRVLDLASDVLSTLTGSAGAGYLDGASGVAKFNRITSIALDGTSLYVLDSGNSVLRKVSTVEGSVSSVTGSANYRVDQDGVLTTGSSYNASGAYLMGVGIAFGSGVFFNSGGFNGALGLGITGSGIYILSAENGIRIIH